MSTLDKLSKKTNLENDVILRIFAQQYMLDNIYTKKELKSLDVTFKGDTLKILKRKAKVLGVSVDAIVGGILYSKYCDKEKLK